ncbi:hypothetical protein VNO77_05316 [Canavalia gladiata]|uniref:Uncharacterized protein n=1 Tax=Canavalia gladiata TaxID=3824 RepID=A0AAN9R5J6_CANGL
MLDLRSNSMLCSMLSIIAAGYLVNCDFLAWGVAYDIIAAGLPGSLSKSSQAGFLAKCGHFGFIIGFLCC